MRLVIKILIATVFLMNITVPHAMSQFVELPKEYYCNKSRNAIIIDGVIGEEEWRSANWTSLFSDIEHPDSLPQLETRVKMLWDSNYLYIAAYMEEPHIWARLDKDESIIYLDNDFEVFIDPDGDNHLYAEYEFNALNTKWDLLLNRPYRDGGIPIFGWNSFGLKHAVHIQGSLNDPTDIDTGWSIEIAIPLKDIEDLIQKKPKTNSGTVWRINFSRVEWETSVVDGEYVKTEQPENNWVWSPQWKINMHRPEYWGYLYFVDEPTAKSKMNLQDVHWEEKINLMTIYEAQKKYKRVHESFAIEMSSLSIPERVNTSNFKMISSNAHFLILGQSYQVNHLGKLWKR